MRLVDERGREAGSSNIVGGVQLLRARVEGQCGGMGRPLGIRGGSFEHGCGRRPGGATAFEGRGRGKGTGDKRGMSGEWSI